MSSLRGGASCQKLLLMSVLSALVAGLPVAVGMFLVCQSDLQPSTSECVACVGLASNKAHSPYIPPSFYLSLGATFHSSGAGLCNRHCAADLMTGPC